MVKELCSCYSFLPLIYSNISTNVSILWLFFIMLFSIINVKNYTNIKFFGYILLIVVYRSSIFYSLNDTFSWIFCYFCSWSINFDWDILICLRFFVLISFFFIFFRLFYYLIFKFFLCIYLVTIHFWLILYEDFIKLKLRISELCKFYKGIEVSRNG